MYLLGEGTIELLCLRCELEQLALHLLYVLHPPYYTVYLLHQVLRLLSLQHHKTNIII